MSMFTNELIRCPSCGVENTFRVWDSLNVTLDPEQKEMVRSGRLFEYRCKSCGSTTIINYPILYHDMEERIMIQVMPTEESESISSEIDPIKTIMGDFPFGIDREYLIRYVPDINGLMEKVKIFDNGYDDRIIELDKLFCKMHFTENNPDVCSVRLYYQDEDEELYIIVGDEEILGGSLFDTERYVSLLEEYKEEMPNIKDSSIVNQEWAMDFLLSKINID